MAWRCVFDSATGKAISYGTDIESPLLPGQDMVLVDGPPTDELMWDQETRGMVPRPPKITEE